MSEGRPPRGTTQGNDPISYSCVVPCAPRKSASSTRFLRRRPSTHFEGITYHNQTGSSILKNFSTIYAPLEHAMYTSTYLSFKLRTSLRAFLSIVRATSVIPIHSKYNLDTPQQMAFSTRFSELGLELILVLILLREPILFKILQGLRRCRHLCASPGNTFACSKTEAAHCDEVCV